jgi:hypothetical protein
MNRVVGRSVNEEFVGYRLAHRRIEGQMRRSGIVQFEFAEITRATYDLLPRARIDHPGLVSGLLAHGQQPEGLASNLPDQLVDPVVREGKGDHR